MSNLTIIGYYPGAGGNRFLRNLEGKEFRKHASYDNMSNQLFQDRYPDSNIHSSHDNKSNPVVLTHCMNVATLNQQFAPTKIIIIKSNFKQSLMRQWALNGIALYINQHTDNNNVKLNSAWTTICWHHAYYETYPNDTRGAIIIDIETDSTEFAEVMRSELNKYSDEMFEFCWDTYKQLGPTAPIIDLYNNQLIANRHAIISKPN